MVCAVILRVCGDFPSSLVIGVIGEVFSMHVAFICLFCVCFAGAVYWMQAWLFARNQAKSLGLPLDEKFQKFERELKQLFRR